MDKITGNLLLFAHDRSSDGRVKRRRTRSSRRCHDLAHVRAMRCARDRRGAYSCRQIAFLVAGSGRG